MLIIENFPKASWTAQNALAGYMWPTGRVLETPDLVLCLNLNSTLQ